MNRHNVTFPETLKYFADFLGIDSSIAYKPTPKKKKPLGKPTAIYQYKLNGKVIHETLRYSNPKSFRQRVPDKTQKSGYKWTLAGIQTVPYHADEIKKAETVYIVEGERDADTLKKIGLVGTCNSMGAGKWPNHLSEWFKNKDIIVLPDNDDPGREHAKLVSNKLYDVVKSLKILNLPGLKEGGDVSDWLAAGNSKETLVELIKSAKPYQDHIDFLNQKHAAIMLNGKFSILNNDYDAAFERPLVSFSSVQDLYYWYGNRKIPNPDAGKKGQKKEISIVADWLYSSRRNEFTGIVFDPKKRTNGVYNLWRGFAFEPKKGDWSLLQNHIKDVIANGHGPHYRWIITWMARIVQDPGGRRPGTSIVLRGDQGVGKGVFLNNFGKLFGSHYFQANNQKHLTGRFNAHLKDILFLFVDEGFWAGDKACEGILKGLITEDTISIEHKGKDAFTIKNNVNLAMASNNDWVVPSGLFERRFFVLDVSTRYQQDHEYFGKIIKELNDGGYEAMLYDLMRFDLTTADIRVIPRTDALLEQIVESMSPVQKFWFNKLRYCVLDEDNRYDGENGWLQEGESLIQTKILYDQYVESCNQLGISRKKDDCQFGKELKKFCPKVDKRYLPVLGSTNKKKRKWHYEFPRLQVCRDLFEKKMGGIQYCWDEDKVFVDREFE